MDLGAVATFGVLAISVAQAFLPVPQVEWGFAFAKRGNERMRWVMYRRPLAGVFEFGSLREK
jgi:hypothetical protein